MRLAIMQPYFLPYIGYYQLMAAADLFIVYDNIKYTKKGWINRNRMLLNGADATFSIPLKAGSDLLDVRDRELATGFDRDKLLNQFRGAYSRAPEFERTMSLLERIVRHEDTNLFRFIRHAISASCEHLGIRTETRISSEIHIDHSLRNQEKVLALCAAVGADEYLNPIGGTELYAKDAFRRRGVELRFLRPEPFEYRQFGATFVPWLSIVDVLMFNPLDTVHDRIVSNRELV
jgi:hypothetical protein